MDVAVDPDKLDMAKFWQTVKLLLVLTGAKQSP